MHTPHLDTPCLAKATSEERHKNRHCSLYWLMQQRQLYKSYIALQLGGTLSAVVETQSAYVAIRDEGSKISMKQRIRAQCPCIMMTTPADNSCAVLRGGYTASRLFYCISSCIHCAVTLAAIWATHGRLRRPGHGSMTVIVKSTGLVFNA